MLRQLYIRNYTLIDELDMMFHPGFSVITGETGAGKSIILGALGLLLGQRADAKSIKSGCDRCTIEAHFDLCRYDLPRFFEEKDIEYDATDCIVRRELTSSGKSRSFINDTPVQLSTLRELGDQLIDIHSQHQNLLLQKEDFQLGVLDIIGKDEETLKTYQSSYSSYRQALKSLEQLRAEIEKSHENEDFLRFQFNELTDAHLSADEQPILEQESETMSHAEDIKSGLYETDELLSGDEGIVNRLRTAVQAMEDVGKVYPAVRELAERMESCHIELKDIAGDVSSYLDRIDFNPAELERINERLDLIYRLEKKYHVETTSELLSVAEDIEHQLQQIDNSDDALAEQEEKVKRLEAICKEQAQILTKRREASAKTVEKEMQQRLVPLGIPNIRFEIALSKKPFSSDGQDQVSFLFSANTSTPLQPISKVASGGEIARVMLSLKAMVSGAVKLPTIIFDEIDTGVSGKIAEQMAQIMREMGEHDRQVISITHLPQIAALGTTHYKVYKEEGPNGTVSHMQQLSPDERVGEIAQMLSGESVSEAAINNAKELLKSK
ncbi:MAG: DNA repair protein RecN [Prevotella sp.]|nr:DNA repair protein RecN [Prevotella sp.]